MRGETLPTSHLSAQQPVQEVVMPFHSTPPDGGGLYIVWLSDTHYYGGRCVSFTGRWARHLRQLKDGTHPNRYMQHVYIKHGCQFRPEVLKVVDNPQECLIVEQEWLDQHFGSVGCMNASRFAHGKMGGERHSEDSKALMRLRRLTPEVRAKISATLRGRPLTPAHRKAISEGNKGKTLTPEHIEILRQSNRDRVWDEEARRRNSEAHAGLSPSAETRAKMAKTRSENPLLVAKSRAALAINSKKITPEAIAIRAKKTAEKLRGRSQTPEHIANAAKKRLGSKRSEETKARMSESAKIRAQRFPTAHSHETRALIASQQLGRCWINNGDKNLNPLLGEVQSYLDQGWSRGKRPRKGSEVMALPPQERRKGRVWVNDGSVNRKVFTEELPKLLDEGWILGSIQKKIDRGGRVWVNNGVKSIPVFPDQIPDGWVRGRLPGPPQTKPRRPTPAHSLSRMAETKRGKVAVNNGTVCQMATQEEANALLSKGWVRGRLK